MPLLHLETLPHAGLPEWQHRQRCASISRFHELGGVLDFQQFAYTTAAANEIERREYHLATANHTLHAVIAERNAQAMQRAARYQVPAPAPLAQHFSLQTDMGRNRVLRQPARFATLPPHRARTRQPIRPLPLPR